MVSSRILQTEEFERPVGFNMELDCEKVKGKYDQDKYIKERFNNDATEKIQPNNDRTRCSIFPTVIISISRPLRGMFYKF